MLNVDNYFDEIDSARFRRAKELSEIKRSFGTALTTDPSGINSKAAVVLSYAAWEGFYNECVDLYVRFLQERGGKVRDSDWMLLIGAFVSDFNSLRDRHHSTVARKEFIANLKVRIDCGFDSLDQTLIKARSNLDFERLSENYSILSFELSAMQRHRIRLNKELVGWRHAVAHGDSPDLSALDIADHVDFTAKLLTLVADCFQYAILQRT